MRYYACSDVIGNGIRFSTLSKLIRNASGRVDFWLHMFVRWHPL